MKTKILILSLMPVMAFAQAQSVGNDVDAELDQLYSGQTAPAQVAPTAATTNSQPVYIVNQAAPAVQQPAIQKQPTTVIEGSPLRESRAEAMRRARQDAEGQTETKIVEKLEQSRLDDEKRRADVLFGDKWDKLGGANGQQQGQQAPAAPAATPAQPQNIQIIVPPAAKEEAKEESTRDIVREELQSALKTEEEVPEQPVEQKYFGALLGVSQTPDASNVTGNYSFGATFGTLFEDTYAVEGSFIYSNSTMNVKWIDFSGFQAQRYIDVNQYAGDLALKYYFLSGMIRPVVGGLLQYSYREYKDSNKNNYSLATSNGSDNLTSNAVDVGAIVGADIQLGKKLALGVDFRYLYNVNERRNYPANMVRTAGDDLESLSSYLLGLTAKMNF